MPDYREMARSYATAYCRRGVMHLVEPIVNETMQSVSPSMEPPEFYKVVSKVTFRTIKRELQTRKSDFSRNLPR